LHSSSHFGVITDAIIIGGSIFFVLCTFFTRPWTYAAWVKVAFWILGVAGVTSGVMSLVLLSSRSVLSRQTYYFIASFRPVVSGVALGVLILFFASGEAYRGWQRWRELKAKKHELATHQV
jgi:hypothetical protein